MMATLPVMSIQTALSVGEPVKKRETSELNELVAVTPKNTRIRPETRRAAEAAFFSHFDFRQGIR